MSGSSRRVGRPSAKDGGAQTTRRRFIEATLELADEVGVEAVTLSGVARRAGYTAPAIYTHFASRTDLLIEALREKLGQLDLDLSKEPAQRVVAWMRQPDPSARRFLVDIYGAASRDDELAALLHDLQVATVEAFVNRGDLDRDEIAAVSLLLLGVSFVDGIQALEFDPDGLSAAVTRMISALES